MLIQSSPAVQATLVQDCPKRSRSTRLTHWSDHGMAASVRRYFRYLDASLDKRVCSIVTAWTNQTLEPPRPQLLHCGTLAVLMILLDSCSCLIDNVLQGSPSCSKVGKRMHSKPALTHPPTYPTSPPSPPIHIFHTPYSLRHVHMCALQHCGDTVVW